jgi:hypothetical protein
MGRKEEIGKGNRQSLQRQNCPHLNVYYQIQYFLIYLKENERSDAN